MSEKKCLKCSKCCYKEIPITLIDIKEIADYLNEKYEEIFKSTVNSLVSSRTGLFILNKKEENACIFLNSNYCLINSVKPYICILFFFIKNK